ncbi:hypothetical protein ACIPRL_07885 [Streptomyces sp. NPDC090085]|uniref:hypothetical protein n=1 Tax=Streptomyces sp. NPDC090085 TaxID=3365943 RepID=UPI003826BA03
MTPAELQHSRQWSNQDVAEWTGADYHLSPRTRQKLADSVPDETRRAYERWWHAAADWCTQTGRVPLPMHTNTLTEWTRELTDTISDRTGKLYAATSLTQAVAAVRSIHTLAGFDGMPGTTEARKLIKAHGKQLADSGRRTRQSAVLDRVEQWFDVLALPECDPSTLVGLRNRVLVVYSLNIWTRRSELGRLTLPNVREGVDDFEEVQDDGTMTVVTRPYIDVFFPSSKTDQEGAGATTTAVGRDDALCIVTVTRAWRAALAERGITEGRFLRSVDQWGNIGDSISGDGINRITKDLVGKAGYLVDRNGMTFTAHGWRASGYSVAQQANATDGELRAGGRWSEKSQAAKGYGRSRDNRGAAMRRIKPPKAADTETETTA